VDWIVAVPLDTVGDTGLPTSSSSSLTLTVIGDVPTANPLVVIVARRILVCPATITLEASACKNVTVLPGIPDEVLTDAQLGNDIAVNDITLALPALMVILLPEYPAGAVLRYICVVAVPDMYEVTELVEMVCALAIPTISNSIRIKSNFFIFTTSPGTEQLHPQSLYGCYHSNQSKI
jgi:hypothetical protein